MLQAIVRFALRHRFVVLALAVALLGYAVYGLVAHARYDVFPEFAPPEVDVRTRAPGLSPEQVEVLVTRPVEYALVGVKGIASLRSTSIQGLSLVTVVFDPSTDVFRARQLVGERLAGLGGTLPATAEAPLMMPLTSSTSVVLVLGLTSKTRSLMAQRTLADWTVRPRLLAVPGVAKVATFGEGEREIRIAFRPERLVAHHLALEDLEAAARRATAVKGAGVIVTANQRLVVRVEGPAPTAEDVAGTVVAWEAGRALTLGDVAEVKAAPAVPIGAAAIGGEPGMMIVVSAQYGANTVDVTRGIEAALAELAPTLQAAEVTLHPDLFRPADFIETAVGNLERSLWVGAVLVVLVLLLFLFDLRTAAISLTAIPLSLLTAVVVLGRLGYSLDTLTLGGLAIAIGEVVDDAVIDVENILRRLRENRASTAPRPPLRVVFDASLEVRSAVIYATFAVILVFVPILALPGVAGRLFSPLGIAYVSAILASLVVALTVTPALAFVLLARRRRLPEREPPVMRWVKAGYVRILGGVERHPAPIVGAVLLVTAGGFALVPSLRTAFIPRLHENHYIVHMATLPGTSLETSLRLGGRVARELSALPFVRRVAQRAGRADEADDVLGSHESEIDVDLSLGGGLTPEAALARIRQVLARFPAANFSVNGFLEERIDETVSGEVSAVVADVYGDDLGAIAGEAGRVAALLRGIDGARDVSVVSPPGAPQVVVRLRPEALRRWGLAPADVLGAASTAYEGAVVGQVHPGDRLFDVVLVLDDAVRTRPEAVRELPIRNRGGSWVRLGQVADVYQAAGRYSILHRGARRVQTVTANVAGRSAASLVAEAKRRLAERGPLPKGVYVEWTGAAKEQAAFQQSLLVNAALAGLGIVLLLALVLRSGKNLLLVLLDLPFALVGGLAAARLTGGVLSIGALVGFVTVFGITLRNAIMLVSHFEHLVAVEGESWGPAAALRGASERVVPILMTALVTALGLLPLALGRAAAGRELEGPMAIVILGGLVTSTALNLLVLPTLALRFGRFAPEGDVLDGEAASGSGA